MGNGEKSENIHVLITAPISLCLVASCHFSRLIEWEDEALPPSPQSIPTVACVEFGSLLCVVVVLLLLLFPFLFVFSVVLPFIQC